MSKYYTKKEIIEKTGLESRQIQFFADNRAVVAIGGGGKRGQSWKYSQKNLIEFRIIKNLADLGITIKMIKRIVNRLNQQTLFSQLFDDNGGVKDISLSERSYFVQVYDAGKYIEFGKINKNFEQLQNNKFNTALIIMVKNDLV